MAATGVRLVESVMILYTDPGSGALLWQVLMAGLAGLLFYARKITSRFRRRKDKNDPR